MNLYNEEKIYLDKHPSLALMSTTFRTKYRFASASVDRCIELFGEPWAPEVEQVISSLFPRPETLIAAVKGYATFAMQSMRLQAAFERDLKYKAKTHDQAASEVYFNEQHTSSLNTPIEVIY